ncbi:MAG: hypothetical protein BGN97_13945 [Microbacterium sp. 69-10]|uniref:hypothetical protein n=1 Tax=Microbacterium sp. 69-10 TaxID=1895783 RepID=UPI00095BFD55|nr:hypothetical protein [Microbacterium sp. 69-10]OJU39922.1 MAG: hypothetical protein BGN97_13945 [Microbacterium sp. 69-10]
MSTNRSDDGPHSSGIVAPARPLISLPQIAALARVRRPVVSMWRKRFAAGDGAFPLPVSARSDQELFDASEIAAWLADTAHGNNPDAVADAAAFAFAAESAMPDGVYRATIEALLALRVLDGVPLTQGDLPHRAAQADPDDTSLRHEVAALPADSGLPAYVETLIDAAYSPAGAADALRAQGTASARTGASGMINAQGTQLVALLAQAVADDEQVVLAAAPGALDARALLDATAARCGDEAALHVPAESRELRRRLIIQDHSAMLSTRPPAPEVPAVWLARMHGPDTAADLAQLEDLVVELSDHQRLVVVGPDTMLTEPLTGAAAVSRDVLLRSGRVRGIVRLPAGLVPSAVRQSLAVWVVGGPQGGAPLGERFTVVGDLRGIALTDTRVRDLVSDLTVSLGSARDALAHAFRFVRFVRTSALIAAEGSLVEPGLPPHTTGRGLSELAALVDRKLGDLPDPPSLPALRAATPAPAPHVMLGDALQAREARLIPGIRLEPADTAADDGYPVIGRGEVLAHEASDRRIDRMRLATAYPRAQLTLAGDVIVLSGAHPAAVVDADGSSVVEYPARVLRLNDETLAPEVVAADVNALTDALPLRRWLLRRIPTGQRTVLRTALTEIVGARRDAERRASDLAELERLVTDAVVAGALTADPDPTHPEGSR